MQLERMSHINEIKGSSQKQLQASCQEVEQGPALTKSLSTSASPTGLSLGQTDPTSLHLKRDELLPHSQERQTPCLALSHRGHSAGSPFPPLLPPGRVVVTHVPFREPLGDKKKDSRKQGWKDGSQMMWTVTPDLMKRKAWSRAGGAHSHSASTLVGQIYLGQSSPLRSEVSLAETKNQLSKGLEHKGYLHIQSLKASPGRKGQVW